MNKFYPAILVPRGRAPFGQHQESRPLAVSNNGSPRFTDFPSVCACSESSLTNLIGSGLNLLCLQIHSKPECRWTWPEVAILGADQKERGLWGRECYPATRKSFHVCTLFGDGTNVCSLSCSKELWVRSPGVVWIRISDLKSLGSLCV